MQSKGNVVFTSSNEFETQTQWSISVGGGGVGGGRRTLRLEADCHRMFAIVDEVLESQELDGAHLPVVVPVHGELEFTRLNQAKQAYECMENNVDCRVQ